MSSDLEDLYLILSTIQALLDDNDCAAGVLHPITSDSLQKVLENCLAVFVDVSNIINEYKAKCTLAEIGAWSRFKWTFKEKEVDSLRANLRANKLTLNMAISVANMLVFCQGSDYSH